MILRLRLHRCFQPWKCGEVFSTSQSAGVGTQADVNRANAVFNAIPIEMLDITGMSAVVRSYTHPVCALPQ